MPDFEIVERRVLRVEDKYLTATRLRAALSAFRNDSRALKALDARVLEVRVNDVSVRKLTQ